MGPGKETASSRKPRASGGARVGRRSRSRGGRRLTVPCLLCVPSLGREQPRGQPEELVAAAVRSACVSGLGRREEEEAAGAVLQGADAGAGAALPAAALPVGARARAAGAPKLRLTPTQVKIWFQNHRYRAEAERAPGVAEAPDLAVAAEVRAAGLLRRVVVPVLVRDGQPCGGSAEAGTAAARDKSAAPPAAACPVPGYAAFGPGSAFGLSRLPAP